MWFFRFSLHDDDGVGMERCLNKIGFNCHCQVIGKMPRSTENQRKERKFARKSDKKRVFKKKERERTELKWLKFKCEMVNTQSKSHNHNTLHFLYRIWKMKMVKSYGLTNIASFRFFLKIQKSTFFTNPQFHNFHDSPLAFFGVE